MRSLHIYAFIMFSFLAFVAVSVAQTIAPVVSVAPQVVVSPALEAPLSGAIGSVSKASDKIPSALPAWILGAFIVVSELAMRFWPTVKPKSYFIAIALLISTVASGLTKVSTLIGSVGQNLKDPAA